MGYLRLFALTLGTVLTITTAHAQFSKLRNARVDTDAMNMVPDPGFEGSENEPCKWNQGLGKFDEWMLHWTSPTETTPDLLSKRKSSDCWSHPRTHSDGRQSTHGGDNMIGIKVYGKGGSDTYWHEYVQTELSAPLQADSLYYAEVWVNLSAKASKATDNIGIAVSDLLTSTKTRHPLYMDPVVNSDKIIGRSLLGWKKVSGVFRAKGGERYLIIGNFYGDEQTKMERLEDGRDGAYYYIDDVMLRPALEGERESEVPALSERPAPKVVVQGRASTEEVEIAEVEYAVGTTIELRSVLFATGKAELMPESQKELDRLAGLLFDNPYMEIEVSGHTDDTGSDDINRKLSEARAQAVVAYLLHKDVEKERLSYKGFGSILPLTSNETEEGRRINRRVEFKILNN